MFLRFIFSILMMTSAVVANAATSSNPRFISCGQFLYTNSVRIDLDLETMTYEVKLIQPSNGGPDQPLGHGVIAKNQIEKRGDYLAFPLYENSKWVGFVKTTDQNSESRISYFYYKGKTLGGEYPAYTFLCTYR